MPNISKVFGNVMYRVSNPALSTVSVPLEDARNKLWGEFLGRSMSFTPYYNREVCICRE